MARQGYQTIANFEGGLNIQAAPDKIGPNEVAQAENIDFGLQEGAAVCRRGSTRLASVGTDTVIGLFRNYNEPNNLGASAWYAATPTKLVRLTGGSYTASTLATGTGIELNAFGWHGSEALISYGGASTNYYKDDGTRTLEWVMQSPSAAPTVTLSTQPVVTVGTVWTISEGQGTSSGGTATGQGDSSGRITFLTTALTSTNLNTNGSFNIGDYAIDYLYIRFSEPLNVTRISRDYSIGDTSFSNYWHTELDIRLVDDAQQEGDVLVESLYATSADNPLDQSAVESMLSDLRINLRAPKTRISAAADTFNLWAVARSKFELISQSGTTAGWTNIGAVRVVVECTGPVTAMIKDHKIAGSEGYPLNDTEVGYTWWETFAIETGTGTVVEESAPSPISTRNKCQFVQATVVSSSTATGSLHGITHRRYYRQGGYMRDAYFVGSNTYSVTTFTDTMSDLDALKNNIPLVRNVHNRVTVPGNFSAISQPYFDRTFVASGNDLWWSEPNKPGLFRKTNYTQVSQKGDNIQGIINALPYLVIINRDSVYEFTGSVFSGQQANWQIYRTASRVGSKARKVCIKTPYGIPLLDYDGLHMYIPGQGVDQRIPWVDAKMGDVFRGVTDSDPMAQAGSRAPAFNRSYIQYSAAMFWDDRLYLAIPTGTSTIPNTMFVLDFAKQRVQYYTYPFSVTSMFWDFDDNKLVAGTPDGALMLLERAAQDENTSGTATAIPWRVTTRRWSWPDEVRLTNLGLDSLGTVTAVMVKNPTGTVTASQTSTMAVRTNTIRDRYMPTSTGALANYVEFRFNGSDSNNSSLEGVFQIEWDAYPEPPKELYHRTDYYMPETESEFMAIHSELDCLGGTVTGTFFVDGSVTSTFTYTGTVGPQGYVKSVSPRVYGLTAFMEYNSSTPFRHYKTHFTAHPEPPRVTFWRTAYEQFDNEQEWKTVANLLDCLNGTVTGTVFIDNTVVSTHTFTGNGYKGYVEQLPVTAVSGNLNHPFGRSAYVIYTASSVFKHYNTWFERLPEPSRVKHWRTPTRIDEQEQEYRTVKCELNCFGNTVLGTQFVDGVAVSTHTFSGTAGYQGFVQALPLETYGRSCYMILVSTGLFKPYMIEWDTTPEPPRIKSWREPTIAADSQQILKTWVAHVNSLSGTMTGTVRVNGTAVATRTFVTSTRTTFNEGLDVNSSLIRLQPQDSYDVVYTASTDFKHYFTKFETEPTPFLKKTWQVTYRKIGGATQLDRARFWSLDAEYLGTGTATITQIWDVDGVALLTNTLRLVGRQWIDRIEFPPNSRGYLFSQRLYSPVDIKVWRSNIDVQPIGIKGFTRRTINGVIDE